MFQRLDLYSLNFANTAAYADKIYIFYFICLEYKVLVSKILNKIFNYFSMWRKHVLYIRDIVLVIFEE